ncbi:receptor-like protein EIX2 [Quercus robur]|uniref:receptor-like protein EIX2 n=1 Tax=Quercus robur TaxID=38942 RepID=UPI0021617D22|nr:receptor-like protein EIX2 [Quercus robur]
MNVSKQMEFLDLEKNLLSGEIADCWMMWQRLSALNLGNNNFTGSIPASIGSLIDLRYLHLYDNKFSGKLPSSLKNCKKPVTIDIGENEFVGSIPSWIGQLSKSMILSLRSNNLYGLMPKEVCALTSLQILDLSHNKLFGGIPICVTNFSAMTTTNNSKHAIYSYGFSIGYAEHEQFESALLVMKGRVVEYGTILGLVKSIDLSKNNFSGEIPNEVTSLQGLQSLNLSFNIFIGRIPESIVGKIPSSTQLQSLNASSFIGNELCGPPLIDNCTLNDVNPNIENKGGEETGGLKVDWFYSQSSDFLVPVDISGVLSLPSPSSSSHCQKRVTAVTPTVPANLGFHCSAHPTVKAKALSDRTDNPEQNPTKNGQKKLHTRLHAPPEVSASRARAPRTATCRHAHSRAIH